MFSTAVKIDQLNDYLSLSEECVLPVGKQGEKYEVKIKSKITDVSKKNAIDDKQESKRILVGLSDCMSCSGCLTSSEDIILRDRGYEDIAKKIGTAEFAVVSIAPQTAFMFAAAYKVSHQTAYRRLSYLLRTLGAKKVYDMQISEQICIEETKREFKRGLEKLLNRTDIPESSTNTPNCVDHELLPNLPIIAAHCPGWTTYAEKSLDASITSNISKVASSQQIQGALIKTVLWLQIAFGKVRGYLGTSWSGAFYRTIDDILRLWGDGTVNAKVSTIYHVTTAPCYDKKVEALKAQNGVDLSGLYNRFMPTQEKHQVQLVDDVISTGDLQRIMELYNLDFATLPEADLDDMFTGKECFVFNKLFANETIRNTLEHQNAMSSNGSFQQLPIPLTYKPKRHLRPSSQHAQSGGLAQEVKAFTAKYLGIDDSAMQFQESINRDYKEATLLINNLAIKFVMAYGFRNIQNIVNKLKKMDHTMAYIEVMACPEGCFNGAGQVISPPEPHWIVSHVNNAIKRLVRSTAIKLPELAKQLYATKTEYEDTDAQEDIQLIANVVIPTINNVIGTNLIATQLQTTGTKQTGSLKW
ncbi:Iron only hydrogenase large subunit C-terminal domain family protein [Babesia bovis T2Bo]|uniref:Nuclear prelamin A recognition factor-like, putative n=1 Tax=Babesia bovis TaxID=5865 RepID=A7AWH1_BABBO|nr:Iron only hydrogenase large subunit C-terminal domain family protein [Babesia bovis T2Bo]EDO05399.1 Iron only hydrogenase large subunit C-terminal domain family protein [Babesia bovis T2Bo]|eukprot:XP_001608967.1 nuclear prelamin A recognition factor-like [Babesia bovis T2Bo]